MFRRLGAEKFQIAGNDENGKKRRDTDAQFGRQLVFRAERRQRIHWRHAHERTSWVSAGKLEVDGMFSHFSGTGSNPNFLESGWQRSRRFRASHEPRVAPKRSMAS